MKRISRHHKMWHFTIRKYLSAYLDGELDDIKMGKIEDHLQGCEACQREFESIRKGKTLASHFEFPEWEGSERVWIRMRNQLFAAPHTSIQPGFGHRLKEFIYQGRGLFSVKRSVLVFAALTMLIIVNNLVRSGLEPSVDPPAPIDRMSNNAFDYGLYLSALSENREPKAFENQYGSQSVSYEVVQNTMPFRLASFSHLPDEYQLTKVQLLKNACCHAVQCIIQKDSRRVIVFQQPKEHPFTFGNHPIERTDIEGQWYHKVEVGSYQALSWVEGQNRFVAMSERLEEDIRIIKKRVNP
ncbi:zf-HC2 domain-containing protein [Caldithrix abyssi]|nr:zf-HC2 domain-containing protein [Caldithrix abyssi]